MSSKTAPTIWQRISHAFRALRLFTRRFFFHLTRRYRVDKPAKRTAIYEFHGSHKRSTEDAPVPQLGSHSDFMVSSSEFSDTRNSERSTHADHSQAVVDQTLSSPREERAMVEDSASTYRIQQSLRVQSEKSRRLRQGIATTAPVANETKDVQDSRLAIWFGRDSRRQKLWLFTTVTAVAGMILALILLFQGHTPTEEAPLVQVLHTKSATKPKPQEKKPEPEPIPTPEPPPEEKTLVVEELPEPPAPVDLVSVEVELLPAPDDGKGGDQFELSSDDRPTDPNQGFEQGLASQWQRAGILDEANPDPWSTLERLASLVPFEPVPYADRDDSKRELAATFQTTQPRTGTQNLLLPYDLMVKNTGQQVIDRLVLAQTLPDALKLQSTSAVHDATDRTLRWEYDKLSPGASMRIPMVAVPLQQGQITPQTQLEIGTSVSSRTRIQAPGVEMEIIAQPTAPLNEYHQLVFRLKNTGELPLNRIRMAVQLSENLWHRFGNQFIFTETKIEVGQTREALLHVKTKQPGPAQLVAKLITEEDAEAKGVVAFNVKGTNNRPTEISDSRIESPAPSQPATQSVEPEIDRTNQPVPQRSDAPLFEPPEKTQPSERETASEPANRKPLIPADPLKDKQRKPEPNAIDEKQDPSNFPGSLDPFAPAAKPEAPSQEPRIPQKKKLPEPERKPMELEEDPFGDPKKSDDSLFDLDE